jgi:DNA-binding IclR family transcriptional regulator
VATGKVLLAHEADALLARYVNALPAFTPRTITDGAAFLAALAAIRVKGYGVNLGEWRDSVRGVAAPIRNALDAVVAAVGVSGPADRLTQRRIAELAPHVMATAEQISAALGHRPAGGRERASTQAEFLEA